jgi:Ca2+-transporting ATPase
MNGRVIETSLVRSAALRGIRVDGSSPAVLESLPFSAARKFSACVIDSSPKRMMILLGAPDVLLERVRMSSSLKEKILAQIDALASSGALVLGVASRALRTKTVSWSDESSFEGLTFEGLITLRDPVRPGVPDALRSLHRAGICMVIMTGDHRGTALAVARVVGMDFLEGSVIDATELRMLSDEAVISMLSRIYVVARVSPEDKLRMVRLYQRAGEVVAMTGDGVNDAPSIKQADIGIAMGSGTAVARDVADLVLLDDNYETIAAAAEEGRQVIHNIRKVMVYLLSNVADALFLIGGSLLMGLTLPLSALQILWVNFFADSFPAVAFAFERDGGLSGKPYRLQEGLFDPLMRFLILFIGIATSALLFFLYWFLLREGYHPDLVRTFIFACFGSYTLIVAFPVRSLEKSIFEYPAFSNRYLLAGAGIGIVLMALSIYLPFFQSLFNTVSLPLVWILGVIAVWVINIAAIEFGKWLFRKDGVRV